MSVVVEVVEVVIVVIRLNGCGSRFAMSAITLFKYLTSYDSEAWTISFSLPMSEHGSVARMASSLALEWTSA